MIHLIILAAALLHLQDPAGDAVGDGSLTPPTAPVYANTSDFDLQSVSILDDPKLTVRVTLGSLTNPGDLPNGFSNPIVEVYLDTGRGGAHALLPGSTMSMPPKQGWNVALRATGDQVYAVTPQAQGNPGSWPHQPATVDVQGNALVIHTQLPRPDHAEVYALTGVYDPFTSDGWRPLTTSVSPWAFSSSTQRAPVVDLLANGMSAQRRAIDSGVLIPYRSPTHGLGWLLLVVLGLIVAAAGLVLRRRVPSRPRRGPVPALPPPRLEAPDRRLPSFWGEMPPIEPSFLDEVEEASLWPDADSSVARAAEDARVAADDPANGGAAHLDEGAPAGAEAAGEPDAAGTLDAGPAEERVAVAPEPEPAGRDAAAVDDRALDAPVADERRSDDGAAAGAPDRWHPADGAPGRAEGEGSGNGAGDAGDAGGGVGDGGEAEPAAPEQDEEPPAERRL
ncbi:MAG TPA: glucodextranase DOMON-like domain-containing protein [Trueperaceae bacterium]|nr:glucodextranase DOMON-like domain-containing protein [Trueperaceae bacterium]